MKSRRRSPWAWRVGSIAGIPIRVHVTLLLLLAWIGFSGWFAGLGPESSVLGVLLVAIVFALIVLHEAGHALMARRFGISTRDILLLPFGGIASLERIPEKPAQELAIAIVGPAINVAIAGVLALGLVVAGGSVDPAAATSLGEGLVARLVWINLLLAAFNMLPAIPLDGGRVLRALLAMWVGRGRATSVAVAAGRVLAVVLIGLGLWLNVWLVLIGVVVWIGAGRERELAHLRDVLGGVPASSAMSRQVESVDAGEPVQAAAARMLETGVAVVPVSRQGQIVGVVTRGDVAQAIAEVGPGTPVAEVPRHDVLRVAPDEPLDHLLEELAAAPGVIAVVVDGNRPIGIVTPDQLVSYAMLHEPRTHA